MGFRKDFNLFSACYRIFYLYSLWLLKFILFISLFEFNFWNFIFGLFFSLCEKFQFFLLDKSLRGCLHLKNLSLFEMALIASSFLTFLKLLKGLILFFYSEITLLFKFFFIDFSLWLSLSSIVFLDFFLRF